MEKQERITFEDIKKANETIMTTGIERKDKNGDTSVKQYAEVNQRIKAFRQVYPTGSIETDILSNIDGVVVMKATVKDCEGKVLGTGTAYEKEGSTFINKTSYIENCETSAVGRALAMCGFGIDTSIASKEEVENAIAQQEDNKIVNEETKNKTYRSFFDNYFHDYPNQLEAFLKKYGIERTDEIDKVLDLVKIDKLITKFKKYSMKEKGEGIYSQEETF